MCNDFIYQNVFIYPKMLMNAYILSPITRYTDIWVTIVALAVLGRFFAFLEIFIAYIAFLTLTSGSDSHVCINSTPITISNTNIENYLQYRLWFLMATFFPKNILLHLCYPVWSCAEIPKRMDAVICCVTSLCFTQRVGWNIFFKELNRCKKPEQ